MYSLQQDMFGVIDSSVAEAVTTVNDSISEVVGELNTSINKVIADHAADVERIEAVINDVANDVVDASQYAKDYVDENVRALNSDITEIHNSIDYFFSDQDSNDIIDRYFEIKDFLKDFSDTSTLLGILEAQKSILNIAINNVDSKYQQAINILDASMQDNINKYNSLYVSVS